MGVGPMRGQYGRCFSRTLRVRVGLATMSGRTWYPKHSVFQDESCEESSNNGVQSQQPLPLPKQKKVRSRIERRREPTVIIEKPKLKSYTHDTGYSTIESSSSHDGAEHFYQQIGHEDDTTYLKICGWRDNEHSIAAKGSLETLFKSRCALQSREVSSRLYSSKLSFRLSRKRDSYQFKHLPDVADYMSHYSSECSYSSLTIATQKETTPEEFTQAPTPGEDGTNTQSPAACGSPATSQLHRLASRIGVQNSIRKEGQLLKSPRPVTVSIKQRRSESREDLVVSAQGKGNETSTTTSKVESPKKEQLKEQLPGIFKMAKKNQKDISDISFSNYLHINRGLKTDELKTDDNDAQTSTQAAIDASAEATDSASSVSSNNITTEDHHQPQAKSPWPRFSLTDTSSDGIGKEEAVRRKADSLGLLSHKWAKNFIERGFMNGSLPKQMYYDFSRPATRGNSTSNSSDSTPKRSTKDLSNSSDKMQMLNNLYSSKPKSAWNSQRPTKCSAQKDRPKRISSTTWKPASAISAKRPTTSGKSSVKNSAHRRKTTDTNFRWGQKWNGPSHAFKQEKVNGVRQQINSTKVEET